MLTPAEQEIVRTHHDILLRRQKLLTALSSTKRRPSVGPHSAKQYSRDHILVGIANHLDAIAKDSGYCITNMTPCGVYFDPQIFFLQQFLHRMEGDPQPGGRSLCDLVTDATNTITEHAPEKQIGIFIPSQFATGQVYVPTTDNYRTLLEHKHIARAEDMWLSVGNRRFARGDLNRCETLTIARALGERHSVHLFKDLPLEDIYKVLHQLEEDWKYANNLSRKKRNGELQLSRARMRYFANDHYPAFCSYTSELYAEVREFIRNDRDHLAILVADYWVHDF